MDKETLSNYGWIVICVLVLAVMIALATPFGSFISNAVQSTAQGLFDVNRNALNQTGLLSNDQQIKDTDFEDIVMPPANGGITFSDNVQLNWNKVQKQENGDKYGYDASKITNEKIENNAFNGANTLSAIQIPNTITYIGEGAFNDCSENGAIEIYFDGTRDEWYNIVCDRNIGNVNVHTNDGNFQSIGTCGQVKWIIDNKKLIIFGSGNMDNYDLYALQDIPWNFAKDDITQVEIEEGVTSIGKWSFAHMLSLEDISIPSTVQSIGIGFATYAKKLKTINVDAENQYFVSDEYVLYTKDYSELIHYPSLKQSETYYVNENTITIRAYSAMETLYLKNLYFNADLELIGAQAFEKGYRLTNIYFGSKCDATAWAVFRGIYGEAVFHLDPANTKMKVYDNCLYTYDMKKLVAVGKQLDGIINIPEGVEHLDYAFTTEKYILILPESLKTIGSYALHKSYISEIKYCGSESAFNNITIEQIVDDSLVTINTVPIEYNYSR